MPDIFINPEEGKEVHHKKAKKHHNPSSHLNAKTEVKHVTHEDSQYHSHHSLSSFCYYPHDVSFINQEPEEEVVLLVRRHPFTNTGWILVTVLMAVGPLFLDFFPILSFMPGRFQLVALLIWYLVALATFVQGFLSWFFSVNIITNKRVVDVDFVNLIYRRITDAEIGKIEDVTVQMGSVVRTLFDYGDVLIQTAAEIPEVEFEGVPHPDQIDKILSELRMKIKED